MPEVRKFYVSLQMISPVAIKFTKKQKMTTLTKNISKIAFVTSLLLSVVGCGKKENGTANQQQQSKQNNISIDTTLQSRIKKFATKPRCKGAFGLYVYDLTADKPLFADNEHQPQPSASCMKLLSGVAGLHLLGTHYLYHTSVYTNGTLHGDTLVGDLAFKGDLDPQLYADNLKPLIHAFREKGIRHLSGKFYVDLLLHDAVKAEQHWYPYDLALSKFSILYRGDDFFLRTLKAALRQEGITVANDQIVIGSVPKTAHCIFRQNRHINLVIQRMWKNSANTQATSLLYTIGHTYKPQATDLPSAGIEYLHKFIHDELKSTEKGLVIHDGCGLCTKDELTPYFLCEILRYGYANKPIYNMLNEFLAVSGEDGTLRRWPQTVKGKIHAKTGTLSHPYGISSLAGYAQAANGHMLCFAIMDSDMSVLDAHVLQKDLCQILVDNPTAKKK